MPRPQTHLRAVAEAAAEPNGTATILRIVTEGLGKLQEAEKARRLAERGTLLKMNPSISDAGKCPRKVVLSLLNIPETNPPDTDTQIRFAVGHAFEEAMAQILEAYQGATYLREERVEIPAGATKITGRRDFDAVRMELDESMLELKASNARAVGFLLKRGSPNEDHIRQCNLYLHATNKKRGFLVYFATGSTKGEPVLHSWIVDYDPIKAWGDIESLVGAHELAQRREVPHVPSGYTRNAFPCGYCGFKDLCFGGNLEAALQASIDLKKAEASS